jgi:2,4-dienoyl-CoA reductase-like NADH-dependent reductase (Old Yellow Enzyme family)
MNRLAEPLTLRGVTLKNRIMVSPMCTYACAPDGLATDWQFAHYGRLAMGGAGLVMLESTSIDLVGRNTYGDLGLWSDAHIAPLASIAAFIKEQGAVPAIQFQHAGRKASTRRPWHGGVPLNAEDAALRGETPWQGISPSPVPLCEGIPVPREIRVDEMPGLIADWVAATRRAVAAGFEVVEVHAAHGYLLHQFLSPITNRRRDDFGGSLENRMRLPLQLVQAVRDALPAQLPLFVRISAVDGAEMGWTLEESVIFSSEMKARGVDVVDCSSGGIGGSATSSRLARSPGFQVPLADTVRHQAGVATVAVGLILTPEQAEAVVADGHADIVAIGREHLANPNWANMALTQLDASGSHDHWPPNLGWWLDKRAAILRAYEAEQANRSRRPTHMFASPWAVFLGL